MRFGPLALALVALGAGGCGSSEIGSAPEVKVSAEQRAKDLNSKAEVTVKWLEEMSPSDRQTALTRTPGVKASLNEVTDASIKARIAALGL